MYYRSNNTVIQPSIGVDFYIDRLKNTFAYVMNEVVDKLEQSPFRKQRINDSVVAYNSEKLDCWDKIYSMTYSNINSLAKNHVTANIALDDILDLDDNWNDNGAQRFTNKLVDRCREVLNQLVAEPFICPTACGSIQFEYEKDNGEYLEFEIYEDRIEVYRETLLDGEEEFSLYGINANDKMKQMVVDFYG